MRIRKSTMDVAIAGAKVANEYRSFEDLPRIIQDEINEIMSYIYSGGIFSAEEAPTGWWALEVHGLNFACDPPKFAPGGLYQFHPNERGLYSIWRMNRPCHSECFGHDIVDVYELVGVDEEEEEEEEGC